MLRKTLFLGSGGAGGKLVNTLININKSVNGIFINSNLNEMKKLDNLNLQTNNFLHIAGDGTGRNRDKAMESLEFDKSKIMDYLNTKIGNYNTYVIVVSLDGGFGSGSFPLLSKAIKNLNRRMGINVDVNLIGIWPKLNTRKTNLENCFKAYNDITELVKEGYINSYQFIDNNKMNNELEFNSYAMSIINDEYEINNDELDSNDARLINNAIGYKIALELKGEYSNDLNAAIREAAINSPFVMPQNIGRCTHFGCSLIESEFNKEEVLNSFNVINFDKEDYNDSKNIIILGGALTPDNVIQQYEEKYKELEEDILTYQSNDYVIDIDFKPIEPQFKAEPIINTNTNAINNISKPSLSKKDLRDMIDDLW